MPVKPKSPLHPHAPILRTRLSAKQMRRKLEFIRDRIAAVRQHGKKHIEPVLYDRLSGALEALKCVNGTSDYLDGWLEKIEARIRGNHAKGTHDPCHCTVCMPPPPPVFPGTVK